MAAADIPERPRLDLPTRSQAVAQMLRRQILSGDIEAGTRLRQAEIAQRFGVSTTPVREAFAALERDGLIVADPHRGVIAVKPTVAEVSENYAIRTALERLAVQRAVPNLDVSALEALRELLAAMKDAPPDNWETLDRAFHHSIHEAAGLPRLTDMITNLRDAVQAYLNFAAYSTTPSERRLFHEGHVAIFDACCAGDAEGAADRMVAHLEYTAAKIERDLLALDGDEAARMEEPGRA